MSADWTGCFLLTCVTVSSVQLWALSTKLTQQVAVNTHKCPNQVHANKHTHTANAHTPMYTCIHADQPGLLSEKLVHHDWLSNPHTCANNFLSPGDKGEGRRRKKKKLQKMTAKIPIVYLYGTSFLRETKQKKKRFYSLPCCRDDRFIVSIKKRICNKDPCLIAIEKLKTLWDGNLQWSSLFFPLSACGRSPNSLWGFNPIKKTIIYVCTVPEESARPLFSITQA